MTLEEKKLEIFDNYLGALLDDDELEQDDAVDAAKEWAEKLTDEEIEKEYEDMTS